LSSLPGSFNPKPIPALRGLEDKCVVSVVSVLVTRLHAGRKGVVPDVD
jgi:hypothetical protein